MRDDGNGMTPPRSRTDRGGKNVKLSKREVYGAVIVDIEGQLVGGTSSDTLREFIGGLLETGKRRIIINLENVRWANSQGVGMLVGARVNAEKAGGEVVLANVTKKIYNILSVTRLLLFFTTFDTEKDAITYFGELPRTSHTARSVL